MGGAANSAPLRRRRPIAHLEIAFHDLVFVAALPSFALIDGRLDDAELDAGDRGIARSRQADRAEADMGNEEERRAGGEGKLTAPAPAAIAGKHCRRGKNEPGGEGQAPQPDERRRLHHERRRGEGVAERVPGKTGEEMAAQPFGDRKHGREDQDARPALRPDGPGDRGAEAPEERQAGGNRDHREGHQPGELIGVDQKGSADPPQTGNEIAEAECPADGEGGDRSAKAAALPGGGAIDQPDEDRNRQPEDGKNVERRLREGRQRAGDQSDRETAPAPQNDDRVGDGGQWRQDPESAAAASVGAVSAPVKRRRAFRSRARAGGLPDGPDRSASCGCAGA